MWQTNSVKGTDHRLLQGNLRSFTFFVNIVFFLEGVPVLLSFCAQILTWKKCYGDILTRPTLKYFIKVKDLFYSQLQLG